MIDPRQPSIFDLTVRAPSPASDQREQLERVSSRIAALIVAFCAERLASGRVDFHAADLRAAVSEHVTTAPGSADRILRDLRKRGAVAYVVIDRRASLYRLTGTRKESAA